MAREGVLVDALGRERSALARAWWAGVLVTGSTVALAATSAWLIVRAAERPGILSLTVPMGLVQLFALSKAAGRYLERTQTHRAALSVMDHVRSTVARLLEPLVPAGLGPRSAEVVDTVLGDVERVQDLVTAVAGPLLTAAVAGIVSVVVCGIVAPWSALALGLGLVASGIGLPLFASHLGETSEGELDDARRSLVALVDRVAQGGDEYAMAGATGAIFEELERLEVRVDRAGARAGWLRGAVSALATLIAGASVLGSTLLCARALVDHDLSRSLLAVPALMSVAALELLGNVAPSIVGLRGDRRALARLESLAGRPAPVSEPPRGVPSPASPRVALRDVGMRFEQVRILEGVSFDLEAGARVVVRGPSGGGKTTLARLIAKFLDPSDGQLALEDVDYAAMTSSEVRRRVGFVDDAPYVFATTLAGNLRVAVPGADDEALVEALRDAGLGTLLENASDGLDTSLDGVSGGLSGGERRRLGIARELLAHRRIVVLDEPTEGLDEASGDALRASLARRYRDGALLVVSHLDADARFATACLELCDGRLRCVATS